MRIDELIQELEKVKEEHSNIQIIKEKQGIIENTIVPTVRTFKNQNKKLKI